MKILFKRTTWGLLLILAGVLFLLQNFNLLPESDLLWGGVFALGGLIFLSAFFKSRANWWAAIPAFALFGLALVLLWELLPLPRLSDERSTAAFLGLLGVGFAAVYLRTPQRWWAILAAGVLFSLTAMITLEGVRGLSDTSIFLFGMGLTFFVLAVLPPRASRQRWALWAAFGLFLAGALRFMPPSQLLKILWPAVLILLGLWLLLRKSG